MPLPPPNGLAFPGVDYIGAIGAMFMFLFMATGFPHNIARFLGTRKISKREYWVMLLILIAGGLTPLWIGVAGFAARTAWSDSLMKSNPPIYGDAAATYVSISAGSAPLASLFAASVFAASVATIAGMVMIMATNITRDLINNAYPEASPSKLLWLTKLLLVPFIVIPLLVTFIETPPILSEFMSSSAVAQAGIFFFVVGVSMYWRRATKEGASATMLYGLTMFLFHPKILGRSIGLYHWGIWALLLMFGSGLTYVLVSLVTNPVAEKRLEQLFHPH